MSARARSFCTRLGATALSNSEDTASALKMAYMRMLTPAASEADAIARANAQLAISFMVPLLLASNGAAAADAAASKAKAAAAAQLAADAARLAADAVPVMLVCKRCQQPVHCQVGLDVLQNEALVHEVCVRRGTLQVKINTDAQ
eukprot:1320-Heterococcus_DN1.PRE.2